MARHAALGLAFREIPISLRMPSTSAQILRYSPSGRVPALLVDAKTVIWESLASLEYLAETHQAARRPMASLPDPVGADVRRIVALWRDCRRRFAADGPWLFGSFSAADAMYAPIAARLRSYLPSLLPYGDDGTAQAYVEAVFSLPAMALWEEEARREPPAPPA